MSVAIEAKADLRWPKGQRSLNAGARSNFWRELHISLGLLYIFYPKFHSSLTMHARDRLILPI